MTLQVGIDIAHFPEFENSVKFTKQLVVEQAVFCLPGEVSIILSRHGDCSHVQHPSQAFFYPGYFRVVLVMPPGKIAEACQRITKFCNDHYK